MSCRPSIGSIIEHVLHGGVLASTARSPEGGETLAPAMGCEARMRVDWMAQGGESYLTLAQRRRMCAVAGEHGAQGLFAEFTPAG